MIPAHPFGGAITDTQPQSRSAVIARNLIVGLLEITENPSLRVRRNANSIVTDHEADVVAPDAGSDDQRNAAGRRKFDGVACKIEQHLAQARGVSDHFGWQGLIDIGGDFKLPGLSESVIESNGTRICDQRVETALGARGESSSVMSSIRSDRMKGRRSRSIFPASILE